MIEAIAASALTVYVLLAIVAVVLFIAASNDSLMVAFWTTIIGFAAFQLLSNADPWGYVRENPKDIAFWAAAYFPIGVAWSFFRFWRVLKNKGASLLQLKPNFKPDWRDKTWAEYVNNEMPKARHNKSRIVCWITYWPFSASAYVLVDILCDLGNWLYSLFSGLYQRLADHVTASIIGDKS